jgi:hypothetical protein
MGAFVFNSNAFQHTSIGIYIFDERSELNMSGQRGVAISLAYWVSALSQCGAVSKDERAEIVKLIRRGMDDDSAYHDLRRKLNLAKESSNSDTEKRVLTSFINEIEGGLI